VVLRPSRSDPDGSHSQISWRLRSVRPSR
jgi:hypothetical protein